VGENVGTHMGEMRNACNSSAGKPEGKRPCRKARCSLKDNVKINLK
jgi:hypothetical protein